MTWAEVVEAIGVAKAAYKLEAINGRVRLSVDGLSDSLSRMARSDELRRQRRVAGAYQPIQARKAFI